jgi:hypothetical protein
VVSLRQVEGGVAPARRRRVPHGGGLPDAVQSASFGSLSTQSRLEVLGDYMSADVLVGATGSGFSCISCVE